MDTPDQTPHSTPPTLPIRVPVVMSPYQWAKLLDVIESGLAICNRSQHNAILLYEEIASQLAGHSVHVCHEQNPNPIYRPKSDHPPAPPPPMRRFAEPVLHAEGGFGGLGFRKLGQRLRHLFS